MYTTLFWNSDARDDELSLRPKQSFGQRFLLLEYLGGGGFGQVWRAKDRWLGHEVALKISNHDLKNETLQLRRLPKDRYVNVYDYLKDDGLGASAYSMELLDRQWVTLEGFHDKELATRYKRGDHINALKMSLCISVDILKSLEILHGKKYTKSNRWCHGDIKPQNIFVDSKAASKLISVRRWGIDFAPVAKIGDLGLARESGTRLCGGTLCYRAPEQAGDGKITVITPSSDIFAMGQTIAKLICGNPLDPELDELVHRNRIRDRLQASIPSTYLVEKMTDVIRRMTMTTPSSRPNAQESIRLIHNIVRSEDDWSVISVFATEGTQLKLDEAAESLFKTIAPSRHWSNYTSDRASDMKKLVRDAYRNGLLCLNGHRYSMR